MFSPLPVPMAARITKYLNKYVRRGICLIYMSNFLFLLRYNTCMSSLETGSGRKLSHNGCTAGNFDLPDHGFLLLTCSTGPMEWSTGNSYKAEALINCLRYHTCRSSHPDVRRGICLIYMSSFYFWSPSFARKIRKTNMRYYPEYPSRSWHPILAP
jgi:hypothetical protein